MIVTGYPGIGKTTLASKNDKIIDLESSSFWKYEEDINLNQTENKTRPENWYIYYCQVAQDLSRQGYTVFVSSHPEVRKYLSTHNQEHFCAIFPALSLKEEWLAKLKERYENSKLDKDLRAYEYSLQNYENNVRTFLYECSYNVEYYYNVVMLDDINYDLQAAINGLEMVNKEKEDYLNNLFNKSQILEQDDVER